MILALLILHVFLSAEEKKVQKRKMKAWEIVLLVLGSPIWLSLAIAAIAVIFSLYGALWAVIISLWSVFASLVGCALACIASGIIFIFVTNPLTGIAMIGAGIALAGLSIFVFFACHLATRGTLILAQKTVIGIKNAFTKKEI